MKKTFPYQINVMAYDRPHYLEEFLKSLKRQSLTIDESLLFFWLDGGGNRSESSEIVFTNIDASVRVIDRYFPSAVINRSDSNLGIGLNYRRAERHCLESKSSDWFVFFEDDFVLHPNYLEKLEVFISQVNDIAIISSVSCSGSGYLENKNNHVDLIQVPRHSWGYAQRFSYLQESKDFYDGYYRILEGVDYKNRDHSAIQKYLLANGMTPVFTSQDSVKDVIRHKLGKVSLTTLDLGIKYIGEIGVHFNSEIFRNHGFHLAELSREIRVPDFQDIKGEVDKVYRAQNNHLLSFSIVHFAFPLIHQRDELTQQRDELTQQRDELTQQRDELTQQRDELTQQRDELTQQRDELLNSTIWKVTKPIRRFVNLFKP
jgi:glycosyltransferase involved in cell wall biosynthesis